MTRKIIHVDMDAFYASVEQRDNPALKGKPIAVGGSSLRGVVAAASYEARQYGVRSAMPSVTAKRLCDDLIFVSPRFDVYKSVSHEIRQIFADYTPLIEPLSLDEAYLDVTENLQGIETAYATAKDIRRRIFEQTGLTASAGISYNKFLAKLASSRRKPNGQFVILPEDGSDFISSLPIGKFHGIGPATEKKMIELGIRTGSDLKNSPLEFLNEHFGKAGTWYYSIARGEDHRPVKPNRIRKSYGSEKTFSQDLREQTDIEEKIIEITEKVWRWCDANDQFARTLTVKAKFSDFQQITRSRTYTYQIRTLDQLKESNILLARSLFPLQKSIRLLGVTLSTFDCLEAQTQQLALI